MAVSAQPAPPLETKPRISARKQIVFSLVMLVLVLGAIEASVRAYHALRNVGSGDPEPRGYVVDDPQAGYALKPGYAEGGIRINSLGFRGPEITRDKPAGVQRIVALGDSATFGPSESECAYPFLLPDLLAERQTQVQAQGQAQVQVQAVNAGVEGYRSDRALVHLRRDVLPLQPDVVTVFIGWNDLYQTDPAVESDQLSLRAGPLTRLLTLSDAAQTFRRLFFLRFETQRADTQDAAAPVLAAYQPAGYAERLREIISTAQGAGARVLVLTWPTILSDDMTPQAVAKVHYPPYTNRLADLKALYARYQSTLRQVAAEQRVPLVDIAALFPDDGAKAAYFADTAHFTCQGQALVARGVADALVATGSVR